MPNRSRPYTFESGELNGNIMSDYALEQEIIAKGLIAPRVTPQRIDQVIVAQGYHIFPGTTLTICCLYR